MENFEQHNEVSTSYFSLKSNSEKNDFFYDLNKKNDENKKYEESKNYYFEQKYRKQDEVNSSLSTPFYVKDILNINQTPYYDRNDVWKNDRAVRNEYETYPQSQYCQEYLTQMYPNIPVHGNIEAHWNPEEYYNYNAYCHNFYHQNYPESLTNTSMDTVIKLESEETPPGMALMKRDKSINDCPAYQAELHKYPPMPRRITSKLFWNFTKT